MTPDAGDQRWPAPGEPAIEVFRGGTARALAVLWWAVSAFVLVDIAVRSHDRVSLVVAFTVLASDLAFYAGAWRPAVRLHRRHVVVAGAVRDVAVRLAAVTGAEARGALRIRIGPRTLTTAIVTASARETTRAAAAARQVSAPAFGGGLPSRGPRGRGGRVTPAGLRRMNPQTLDATAGTTQATYCARRIVEEADRARGGSPGVEVVGSARPSAARWVWWPAAVTAALVLAAVITGMA